MIDVMLGAVAPHICKGCSTVGSTLCESCFFNIIEDKYIDCVACNGIADAGNLCQKCAKTNVFDQVFVVGERRDVLKRLVGDFKYNSERASAKRIAELLDATLPYFSENITIVPIPTIAPHIRQRGFDHTKLIAKNLAKIRGWDAESSLLMRRENSIQHGLNARDRKTQAAKAFMVNTQKPIPCEIALIDDIYTTGATLAAAAKLLRKSGVQVIHVAIVARQIGNE